MKKSKKVGRPSGYDPKYCQDILDYFGVDPYKTKTTIKNHKGDEQEIEVPPYATDFPTLAGFAISIGVHRDTLHEWAKTHVEFSDAYKKAKDFQERFLVINGLKGLINTPFAIFTAKNVLGWRDKQPGESDVTINNFQSKTDEDLDRRINELTGSKKGEP